MRRESRVAHETIITEITEYIRRDFHYTISHSLEIESRRTATVDFAAIVGRTRNRHYVNM